MGLIPQSPVAPTYPNSARPAGVGASFATPSSSGNPGYPSSMFPTTPTPTSGSTGLFGDISGYTHTPPANVPGQGQQPYNPYTPVLSQAGLLAAGISSQQNASIAAQQAALQQQLLQPVAGSGGGGGNGAAGALANQAAGLQNQQHDIDINFLRAQLADLPQRQALALAGYHTALGDITAQQTAAKQQKQQQTQSLVDDATARGAMTATGTGSGLTALQQGLVDSLMRLHAQTQQASQSYHGTELDLRKQSGDLTTSIQKLLIQKQLELLQAKSAGLGGSAPNPLAGLANFMKQQSISQQLSALGGQQQNPATMLPQILGQYSTIASSFGQSAAQSWLLQTMQAYGISIPNFSVNNTPDTRVIKYT